MSTMRNITVPADASRLPMTLPRMAERSRAIVEPAATPSGAPTT